MEYVFIMLVLVSAFLLAATIIFFLAAFFPLLLRREQKVEQGGDLEKGVVISSAKVDADDCVKKYGWEDIERLTVNFTAPVIGRGGFSTVYLGKLPDSTSVAVKVHRDSERLHRAFQQELEVLLRIRHRSIVHLVGYCDKKGTSLCLFFFFFCVCFRVKFFLIFACRMYVFMYIQKKELWCSSTSLTEPSRTNSTAMAKVNTVEP